MQRGKAGIIMKKIKRTNEILAVVICVLTAVLAATVGFRMYKSYDADRQAVIEEEKIEQAQVAARREQAQNRVHEMEEEIQQYMEDREELQKFIAEIRSEEIKGSAYDTVPEEESSENDTAGLENGAGAETDTLSENGTEPETLSENGTEPEIDTLSENGIEAEIDTLSENGTEPGTETPVENGIEAEIETLSENGTEPGTETPVENGIEAEIETLSENGTEPGTETLSENGTEAGTDTLSENGIEPGTETLSENGTEPGTETLSENSTVSGNETLSENSTLSGNQTVSENGTAPGGEAQPSRMTLAERRMLRTSLTETLEVNQADKEKIAENTMDFSQIKIACLGDSITAASNLNKEENYQQYSYPSRLKELLGAQEVYNLGIGGSSIGRYWADAFVDRYYQIPGDVDAIIVMGGTNDGFCASDTEFGTLQERAYRTFCGDLDELMRGLRDHYPQAEVFFVTPLPNVLHDYLMRENDYLIPQQKYADTIIALAAEYGFHVIDLYNSNILDSHDADIVADYMTDGVHFNPDGYQIMAEHFAAELIRYYESVGGVRSKDTMSGNGTVQLPINLDLNP